MCKEIPNATPKIPLETVWRSVDPEKSKLAGNKLMVFWPIKSGLIKNKAFSIAAKAQSRGNQIKSANLSVHRRKLFYKELL